MDHLKEYVKGWIELHKSEKDMSEYAEEDIFDVVMEDVVSIVEEYSFADYNREEQK
jgi:hypothetical protein